MLALPTGNHVLLNSSESQLHHAHLPGQQQHTAVFLSTAGGTCSAYRLLVRLGCLATKSRILSCDVLLVQAVHPASWPAVHVTVQHPPPPPPPPPTQRPSPLCNRLAG